MFIFKAIMCVNNQNHYFSNGNDIKINEKKKRKKPPIFIKNISKIISMSKKSNSYKNEFRR